MAPLSRWSGDIESGPWTALTSLGSSHVPSRTLRLVLNTTVSSHEVLPETLFSNDLSGFGKGKGNQSRRSLLYWSTYLVGGF